MTSRKKEEEMKKEARGWPKGVGEGWRETMGNDADGKENRENGARSGSFKEAIS